LTGNATLLRIFIGEPDKYQHQPLYKAVVLFAKRNGPAGVTVQRGLVTLESIKVIYYRGSKR
jgi:PII-like signaling protein